MNNLPASAKPYRDPCIWGGSMVGCEPIPEPVDTIGLYVDGITAKCSRCSLLMDDCLRVGSYLSCRRCGCRMATSNPSDVINLGSMWRDPCIFGGAMVGSEPIIPVAPVDPYAHLRQAVRDGRRIRQQGGGRWEDNGNWAFSRPVEDYEIEPLPAMTGAITARQLCRLWDARWDAAKCGNDSATFRG